MLPYFLIENYYASLAVALVIAVLIIASFNYYVFVATREPFRKRFLEMTVLSLSIAAVSFGIGYLVNLFFGVDV